jgi:hypothetical protein
MVIIFLSFFLKYAGNLAAAYLTVLAASRYLDIMHSSASFKLLKPPSAGRKYHGISFQFVSFER